MHHILHATPSNSVKIILQHLGFTLHAQERVSVSERNWRHVPVHPNAMR